MKYPELLYPASRRRYARHVSLFPLLSLAVKRVRRSREHRTSASEGQTLWALRQVLPRVRVPEIYGWRREGDQLFLFMELIEGETLEDCWKNLTDDERTKICTQLRSMVCALRCLRRPPKENFIGGQPSMDSLFFGRVSQAFINSDAFYEFFLDTRVSQDLRAAHQNGQPHPFSNYPVVFSHCDLNFSNIMITHRTSNFQQRTPVIIDWEQSGWMPSFWEHSKLRHWTLYNTPEVIEMMEKLSEITESVPKEVFTVYQKIMEDGFGEF